MPLVPDPDAVFPIPDQRSVVFLKNVVRHPHIQVGDYSYYHSFDDPTDFEAQVLYNFDFIEDRLIIGRFCSIAAGARFLLNGGNHHTATPSSYPFAIFGGDWAGAMPDRWPHRGDITIGHDVWIGHGATVLPGAAVGHGAVVGTGAVVGGDVPPYAIVVGNPARVVRLRFADGQIADMLALAWWDWPIERITRHARLLATGDVAGLLAAAARD